MASRISKAFCVHIFCGSRHICNGREGTKNISVNSRHSKSRFNRVAPAQQVDEHMALLKKVVYYFLFSKQTPDISQLKKQFQNKNSNVASASTPQSFCNCLFSLIYPCYESRKDARCKSNSARFYCLCNGFQLKILRKCKINVTLSPRYKKLNSFMDPKAISQ